MLKSLRNAVERTVEDTPKPQDEVVLAGQSDRILAFLTAGILIAVVWLTYLSLIGQGGVSQWDEFYTLDRSSGFSRHNDWLTVYSNNEPGFKKPPLQYWMSGLLIETGMNIEVALRLPSMLFALGTLVLTGWLAAQLQPRRPWVIPVAVLLCACSHQFWIYATSAMLDAGATFFATLALNTTLVALRHPRWWYAVAASVGLGALQKAPIGLAIVMMYVFFLRLIRGRTWFGCSKSVKSPQFRRALGLAIVLTLVWPVLQSAIHFDESVFKKFFADQMFDRFSPVESVENIRSVSNLWNLVIAGEPLLRVPALLALLWLPWYLKRPELIPLPLIFLLFVLSLSFADGRVFTRYSLIFVPLLTAALAVVSVDLFRTKFPAWVLLLSIAILSGGPIRSANGLNLAPDERIKTKLSILSELGDQLQPEETLVVCNFEREARFPPGAISYYAATNDRKFIYLYSDKHIARLKKKIENGEIKGTLRGVCTIDDIPRISGNFAWLTKGASRDGYQYWTAGTSN